MSLEEYFSSLEKVISDNLDDMIIDNNVLNINYRGMALPEYLFPCRELSEVDLDYLETNIRFLKKVSDIISNQNICFIEEVKEEFSNFQRIMAEKYKWFKDRDLSYGDASNREKLSILNEIVDELYNVMREVKRKEFRCNTDEHKCIENAVNLVSEEFYMNRAEEERLFLGEKRKKEKKKKKIYTDEKIISVAFNKVLHDCKNVSIISNDDNMVDILNISYDLLSCIELDNCLSGLRKQNVRFFNTPEKSCTFGVSTETKIRKPLERFIFPGKTAGISSHLIKRIDAELSKAF